MRRRYRALGLLALLGSCGCQSTGLPDLSDLAKDPALPYSVLVTGGAFIIPGPEVDEPEPLSRTYRPTDPMSEAFALDFLLEALDQGRVFVRVQKDQSAPPLRRRVAEQVGPVPAQDGELQAFLRRARTGGHDLLLVVERVQDGKVEFREVNGQWPITLAVWLLIGLGMLIPDHTYESQAALHVTLRDVQTGRTVYTRVQSAGSVDLPLTERTGILGILISIIVPPFWVGDDDVDVEEEMRAVVSSRLVASMARQLKTIDVQGKVDERMPAVVRVSPSNGGVLVTVDAKEGVSVVRVRIDGRRVEGRGFAQFESDLLASVTVSEGEPGEATSPRRRHYEAVFPAALNGSLLQVLVQTVTGRVASVTVELIP